MFHLPSDAAEARDLAHDPAHKSTFEALYARFKQISATGVPMAGLSDNSALEKWDECLQCETTQSGKFFRPYAPEVAWPHPRGGA